MYIIVDENRGCKYIFCYFYLNFFKKNNYYVDILN